MSTWPRRRIIVSLAALLVIGVLFALVLRSTRPIQYVCWLLLLVFIVYAVRNIPTRYRQHGLGEMSQAMDHKEGIFWRTYEINPLSPEGNKVGRNDPCPCHSGLKYKRCCGVAPS